MTLEEIAYTASMRSLDKQESTLDELRARTAILLAASSLAASFVGPAASSGGPIWALVLIGIAFGVSTGLCVYILVPRRNGFYFSMAGSSIYEELYAMRDDVGEVQRRLAYQLDRFWDQNDGAMQTLFLAFRVAAVCLALEILGVLTLLADKLV